MNSRLSLAEVISRRTPLGWHEGVALVREVSDQLSALTSTSGVPDLAEILLAEDGTIRIAGATRADEPVRRLGQLLQALLVNSDMPVQLRLVVSQATAPEPRYESVKEFNEALAFFDRPHRSGVLRAVFERATALAPAPAERASTIDNLAPLPTRGGAPLENNGAAGRRRNWVRPLAGAAVTVLATAAALVYLGTREAATVAGRKLVEAGERVSDRTGDAVVAGVSAVTDRLGLGRLVPAEAEQAPSAPPPPTVPERARPKPQAVRTSLTARIAAFDPDALNLPAVALASSWRPAEPAARDAGPTVVKFVEPGADATTYEPGSYGVIPPVAVRPQLPTPPPDLDPAELGHIELVIAVDGTVETVKLVGKPRNVHDAMLLSATKSWQFRPALKDGEPVRYRKTILIGMP